MANNGLPNSGGFPTNVRKIALINGTTNGQKTNSEGEMFLEFAGFKNAIFKAVAFEDRNQAHFGNWSQTFTGTITIPTSFSDFELFLGGIFTGPLGAALMALPHQNSATKTRININPNGCMDVVQGGTFETAKIIATEFSPEFYAAGLAQEWRTFKPNHSFIPTISSLAFKNPNFDWSTPLNRNLICDPANKEIPFDNYFSPSSNEEHVALTQESVDWLLNEFKGIDQTPRFPLDNISITGSNLICENNNTTFSFPDICKVPSAATWTVTPNAQIVSQTGYSVVLKGITNGSATITATFQNGQTITKNIWLGKPNVNATVSLYPEMEIKNKVCFYSNIDGVSLAQQGVIRNLTPGLNGNYCYTGFLAEDENYFSIANSCGTTTYTLQDLIGSARPDNLNLNSKFYKTYPNPTNNIINIELKNIEDKPNDNSIIFAELYNMMGEVKRNVTVNNNIATIEVLGLPTGIYVLKINIDGIIESHQIAIE